MSSTIPQDEIQRFLETGEYDVLFWNFPGSNHLDRMNRGHRALADALATEVRSRQSTVTAQAPKGLPRDIRAFTRKKVEPMVRGLFRRDECDSVLSLLENSLVFLTPDAVESLIETEDLDTAWEIANLYLRSIGCEPISEEPPNIVGFSVNTKCFVSMDYFRDGDPFADYVVHEAAHVFHNTKRRTTGLTETRRKVWLLPIEFRKRETFAYACEAYSRIRELGKRARDRQLLFQELKTHPLPPAERVDLDEYLELLSEAVARRNGWKAILEGCSAKKRA